MVSESATASVASRTDSAFRVRLRRFGELTAALLKNPTTVVGLVLIVLMIWALIDYKFTAWENTALLWLLGGAAASRAFAVHLKRG